MRHRGNPPDDPGTIAGTELAAVDFLEVARLVADRGRLAILGALATRARTLDDLSAAVEHPPATVRRVLGRLIAAGWVHAEEGGYRLAAERLERIRGALPRPQAASPALLSNLEDADAVVVGRYFQGHRLAEIPVGERRRRSVLKVLVDEFEPGRYYPETEVVRILQRFHPDHAALRRHLVDDGLLSRHNASRTYWRGGGPPPGTGA